MTAACRHPDRRGRTGLDRQGRDLTGNPRVRIRDVEVLSCDWYVLRKTTFDFRHSDGHWSREQRETHDRGDGATVLLHNSARRTVLLTRQFRLPAYVNGHPDGMLLETAAGLLDDESPEEAIRREAAEETGHTIGAAEHVFDVYMSPGSVTERLHFFAAPYDAAEFARRWRRNRRRGRGHHDRGAPLRRGSRHGPRRPDRRRQDHHAAPVGGARRTVPAGVTTLRFSAGSRAGSPIPGLSWDF